MANQNNYLYNKQQSIVLIAICKDGCLSGQPSRLIKYNGNVLCTAFQAQDYNKNNILQINLKNM